MTMTVAQLPDCPRACLNAELGRAFEEESVSTRQHVEVDSKSPFGDWGWDTWTGLCSDAALKGSFSG